MKPAARLLRRGAAGALAPDEEVVEAKFVSQPGGLHVGRQDVAHGAYRAARGVNRDHAVVRVPRVLRLALHMIVTSNNLATNLLLDFVGVGQIRATLDRLGVRGVEVHRGVEDEKAYVGRGSVLKGIFRPVEAVAEVAVTHQKVSFLVQEKKNVVVRSQK